MSNEQKPTPEDEDAALEAAEKARHDNIIATAPERIFIQQGEGGGAFTEGEEVTWCQDRVDDDDVEYIRADLSPSRPTPTEYDRSPASEALVELVRVLERDIGAGRFPKMGRDHACSECLTDYPPEGRELVVPDFQCAWHKATATVRRIVSGVAHKEAQDADRN